MQYVLKMAMPEEPTRRCDAASGTLLENQSYGTVAIIKLHWGTEMRLFVVMDGSRPTPGLILVHLKHPNNDQFLLTGVEIVCGVLGHQSPSQGRHVRQRSK